VLDRNHLHLALQDESKHVSTLSQRALHALSLGAVHPKAHSQNLGSQAGSFGALQKQYCSAHRTDVAHEPCNSFQSWAHVTEIALARHD
jgi:hypothetical protein